MNNEQPVIVFEISNDKVHLWHLSLYNFCKNNNATSTTKGTYNLYSKDTVNVKITQLLFFFNLHRNIF